MTIQALERQITEKSENHNDIYYDNLFIKRIKDMAYKEFAEKLKNKWFDEHYDSPDVDFDDFIDNLLKEMVGEEE